MQITPDLLIHAYAAGVFPMAESRDAGELFWVDPEERGILPLDKFLPSRSLIKEVRKETFCVRYNTDFAGVL
jgi:leucyl/phenylalanyl-tRNA--protein transferase